MALIKVSNGNTMMASDINQIANILQCPAGGTETGKYRLTFNAIATNAVGSLYMPTHNRFSTPVSVTVDTADMAPVATAAPSTGQLTQYGFQLYSFATGVNANCRMAGNWTVHF